MACPQRFAVFAAFAAFALSVWAERAIVGDSVVAAAMGRTTDDSAGGSETKPLTTAFVAAGLAAAGQSHAFVPPGVRQPHGVTAPQAAAPIDRHFGVQRPPRGNNLLGPDLLRPAQGNNLVGLPMFYAPLNGVPLASFAPSMGGITDWTDEELDTKLDELSKEQSPWKARQIYEHLIRKAATSTDAAWSDELIADGSMDENLADKVNQVFLFRVESSIIGSQPSKDRLLKVFRWSGKLLLQEKRQLAEMMNDRALSETKGMEQNQLAWMMKDEAQQNTFATEMRCHDIMVLAKWSFTMTRGMNSYDLWSPEYLCPSSS